MHASPYDSVRIFVETKCKKAIGMHWGESPGPPFLSIHCLFHTIATSLLPYLGAPLERSCTCLPRILLVISGPARHRVGRLGSGFLWS